MPMPYIIPTPPFLVSESPPASHCQSALLYQALSRRGCIDIRLGRSLSEVAASDGHHDDKRNQVWVGAILNVTLVVLADFILAVL